MHCAYPKADLLLRKITRPRNSQTKLKSAHQHRVSAQDPTLLTVDTLTLNACYLSSSPTTLPLTPLSTKVLDLNEYLYWVDIQKASVDLPGQQMYQPPSQALDQLVETNAIVEPGAHNPANSRDLLLQWLVSTTEELPLLPPFDNMKQPF
ncbi:hypothetical protein BCR33DRAFT_781685 [Rhizoclosmatium globosum]|uniref:Uncharacterized protein n=1 Tax=Rhizoclosmatium globosum TaxID=329046 RepID=A0A1Y2CR22_9FUNG|nr:hypothetical protein BCR33DRAFT_781685 [Rhizoclosmatium globosum]|eukprot:ORY49413.1 hypothetical protein BCR33DRAFT_781685 [Rhizoclosmatium globosum]